MPDVGCWRCAKLLPIVSSFRLALPVVPRLDHALARAFDDAVRFAIDVATGGATPAVAVHEYRKTVRRLRAVVALCRPLAPPVGWRALSRALRDAHRSMSGLRDLDALAPVAAALDCGPAFAASVSELREALAARRDELDPGLLEALLVEGAERLVSAPAAFRALLPRAIVEADLGVGVGDMYRAARTARRLALKREHELHEWRKRTKELGYLLELLAPDARGKARKRRKAFGALSEQLGAINDLFGLRGFATDESLRTWLTARARALTVAALDDSADLFGARPKRFEAAIVAELERSRH